MRRKWKTPSAYIALNTIVTKLIAILSELRKKKKKKRNISRSRMKELNLYAE